MNPFVHLCWPGGRRLSGNELSQVPADETDQDNFSLRLDAQRWRWTSARRTGDARIFGAWPLTQWSRGSIGWLSQKRSDVFCQSPLFLFERHMLFGISICDERRRSVPSYQCYHLRGFRTCAEGNRMARRVSCGERGEFSNIQAQAVLRAGVLSV